VAEHSIKVGHRIDFNISVLGKVMGYVDCVMKEALEIRLHPNNCNRDRGFTLSHAWYPVTNMLKQSSETPMKK
jgi:hypothetical protein